MKPLTLTIQGINSYRGEQTIDFTELTAYGLFGIFGPTGSGKSSILDAITLALYARLPRSTKNFININEKKASVSFTFSITTDRICTYQIDRSFRYQGKEGAKTVHNISARLLDLTAEKPLVMSDRPTEVTQECIRLLGLSSDDFMRTVVLPQGQFSEFLKLKNRERRGMLQRIFHLEQYGEELNRKISSARVKQELIISNLEGELKSYTDVSPEEIKRNGQQLAEASEDYEKGLLQQKELSDAFQEKNVVRNLLNEYEPLLSQYKKQLGRQDEIGEDRIHIEIARKANQLKPLIDQSKNAAKEYQEASALLSALSKKLSMQQQSFDQLRVRRESFLSDYSSAFPALLGQSQRLQAALQLSQSVSEYQEKKAAACKAIKKEQLLQKKLELQKKGLLDQEEILKKDIRSLEQEAGAAVIDPDYKSQLMQGNLLEDQYRERRLHFEKKRKTTEREGELVKVAKKRQEEMVKRAFAIFTQGHHQLLSLKKQLMDIEKESNALVIKKQENEILLTGHQQKHMAAFLRSSLKDGDVCPVCGHIHHPEEDTEIKQAQSSEEDIKQIKSCERTRERLQREELTLQAERARLQQLLSGVQQELSSLEEMISTVSEAADWDPSAFSGNTEANLHSDAVLLPDEQKQLASPEGLMNLARKMIESFSSNQGSLDSLMAGYQHSKEELEEEHALLSHTLNEIYALRRKLDIESCSGELKRCRQMEEKSQELQKQIREKQKALEKLSSEKETLQASITQAAMQAEGSLRQRDSYESFIAEQKRRFPEGISPDADHQALLNKCRKETAALEKQKNDLEEEYQKLEKDNQVLREEVSAAQSKELQSARHAKETSDLVRQQKAVLGFDEASAPENWYMPETEIEKKEREIEEFQKALEQTGERLRYLEEKLAQRTCSPEEWQSSKDALEKVTEQNEQLQQKITVLQHKKQSLSDRLAAKQELEKTLHSANHRHDLISQLAKLFKGNTFIEYMAESRLRYIAREASQILSDISGGDYTLEVNEAAEFVIRDNKNGGIVRPCDTLSGGETFITSLALALSLSSAIQLNGTAPLELFFLDEGFGSLDNDLLDVVMTSLEHLQNKKRSIGLITHVELVRSRVPVKLSVIPSGEGDDGSRIVMEYT